MSIGLQAKELTLRRLFLGGARVFSLHSSDPGEDGGGEIQGAGYRRMPASFSEPNGGLIRSDQMVEFTGLPTARLAYIGVWGDGMYIWGGPLREPKEVKLGDSFRLRAGDFAAILDGG